MYKRVYPKQEKPLYRYKLNDDGTVTKSEPIYEYSYEELFGANKFIDFKFDKCKIRIRMSELDNLQYGRIYTFTDDYEFVKRIIRAELQDNAIKAKQEYHKHLRILQEFDTHNP